MRFKIRALALALMALAACSAVMASAAQAGLFTAENYPATLTGTQLSGHKFSFSNNYSVTCANASFDAPLPEAAVAITVGATYGECESNAGNEVTVQMTGCDYVFESLATLGEGEVDGRMHILCPDGGGIDFEDAGTGCEIKIGPQNFLNTLVFTNNGAAGDFDVDIEVVNIAYGQNAMCPGGAGMFGNGKYKGKSTITGDFEGEETGVKVD
jgi:hypothetical protein